MINVITVVTDLLYTDNDEKKNIDSLSSVGAHLKISVIPYDVSDVSLTIV